MPALAGQPSVHCKNACMVHWVQGALWRNCRQKHGETSFYPCRVLLFSRNSTVLFLGSNILALVDWEGQESWARPPKMLLLRYSTLVVGLLMGI